MKKNIYFYTNLLAWGLVFLLISNYAFGWVTPTANPPEGDLSAPLDMSSTEQTKTGNLIIDSLLKVGRYTSAPTGATGALYYDTTDNEFKGYKASTWDSLGGEDTDTWITTQTCSTDYALQSVGKESKVCINKIDYSDVAYDLNCTDCIGTTEIADSYVLNTSDAMSGTLTVAGSVGIGTTTPTYKLDVAGTGRFTQPVIVGAPTDDTHAATKGYVDDNAGGGGWYVPSDIKLTTAVHDGNFGGYAAMQTWIRTNGCNGYHVCDGMEIARYLQNGGVLTLAPDQAGWVMDGTGIATDPGDCAGWTYNSFAFANTWYRDGIDGETFPVVQICMDNYAVLCCLE